MENTKKKSQSKMKQAPENEGLEKVIKIDRINKVVKGGKRLAFRAFVITGDLGGNVGFALGKSKEVPMAIRKGVEKANKSRERVIIVDGTVPHEVRGKFGAASVIIRPAKPGTGVIAGGAIKILLEAAGYRDVVAKSVGAGNAVNATKAAMNGLRRLRSLKAEEARRGIMLPVFKKAAKKSKVKNEEVVAKG